MKKMLMNVRRLHATMVAPVMIFMVASGVTVKKLSMAKNVSMHMQL